MLQITTRTIKILAGAFLFFILWTGTSIAIPSLQLYIPGSTYDSTTESWVINASDFELQVLGASSPNNADYITNLMLYVAIPESEYGVGGAYININGSPLILISYGTPPPIPPHSIFPTYYYAYSLPDLMVSTAGETVNNYNPGESGSDSGDIHQLHVEWGGYSSIHFDSDGIVVSASGKTWNRKAPFSHDAQAVGGPSVIPEPSTMLLLIPGLLGLAKFSRKNSNR